ncbi:MAG: GDSL-type esterase/lipase family protein [Verrucomicrobiota bacterium]
MSLNNENAKKEGDAIQLIFDGDSITDFWAGRGKAIWTERYGNYHAFNFGIASDRTEHVLWRLSQGQVDGLHPKLIVLLIGANNVFANPPEQIAEGVKAIVADYRKRCPNSSILLQGIFPSGASSTSPRRAPTKTVNDIICKLADGKKVIYIDFGEKFLSPDGSLSAEIMPDFLHPSTKGYQIWADAIQPIIDQQLGAK